jgi:23S rRNA (cytidine1920-2'-O)/16S rRNA (cytidine1409-2'-O)-methyltransferase
VTGERERLDLELVRRGLVDSRSRAQALILAGAIRVDGLQVSRAGHRVGSEHRIEVLTGPRFVSRGGEKLAHALSTFGIEVKGRVCADIGASTGGFTDCLLQAGAARVHAIDVGYGQLDYRLRTDSRVVLRERVNARHLEEMPEPISLVTIDVSFISLDLILPAVSRWIDPAGEIVALVKPQFEAGRGEVGKGGVVRDPAVHRQVLKRVFESSTRHGFAPLAATISPLRGPAGNVEFLMHLAPGGTPADPADLLRDAMEPDDDD